MFRRTPVAYRFAESFFRHKWIFLVSVLVVAAITASTLIFRGQTFTATAMTQVVTQDVAAALNDNPRTSWTTPAQEQVQHFTDLINDNKKGGFLDTALKRAQLSNPIDVDPAANDPRYDALKKHLSAAPVSDTLFAINLVWNDPADVQKIVSALQAQYIEEVGLDRSANSTAAGRFLDTQIQDYAARLRSAEQALIDYRQQNSGETPEMQNAAVSQLASLKAQMDQAQITAHDADRKKVALQQELASMQPTSLLESTVSASPYVQHLNQLRAELDALQLRYTDDMPAVQAKKQELALYTQQLDQRIHAHDPSAKSVTASKMTENPAYRQVQQQLTDAGIAASVQADQLSTLRRRIAEYEAQIQRQPAAQKELSDRLRNQRTMQMEYDKLLAKREDIRLQGNLDQVSASSTLRALNTIAAEPTLSHSKKGILLLGSILLGLVVGFVILILSEWLNNSLRYEADAEFVLGVPVLATLPEAKQLRQLDSASRNSRLLPAPGAAL